MTEHSAGSSKSSKRQLRERKQRKLYSDEWALGEEEYEGARGFSIAEKLESARFAQSGMVREMNGKDLNVGFFQQYGFNIPLLFKDKTGLGIRVPSTNFTINDVRMCVGSRRILDVMDVNTQKNIEMTMKDWQKYYEDPQKKKLLNVISLEFSHTKLENYVQSPSVVRQIDWVDVVWPKQLKESQIETTNLLGEMMYPKVQKYCLMSVKNCYTDFHIDFGGTSVWYHILKGSKVFWLIPPTEKNLQLYEKWVLSGKQSDIFFGDTVDKCTRVYLTAGNTFFIPTGWIHAVYTPTDTLVFGGNFLHSFGIVKQLKIAQVEDATKVPQKFRYPFFTEMLWYVLAKYVYTLLGKSHLEGEPNRVDELVGQAHIHLTHYELFGLKEIVMYLYDLQPQKKNVPHLIKDPVALIKDVRTLVERHCKDSPEMAITGSPVLNPELNRSVKLEQFNHEYYINSTNDQYEQYEAPGTPTKSASASPVPMGQDAGNFLPPHPAAAVGNNRFGPRGPYKKHNNNTPTSTPIGAPDKSQNGPRRRRTRCKICEACQRSDCGECSFCLDMVKFGGPGRAKQTCMMRQCISPMLPVTAQCVMCHLDGWRQSPASTLQSKSLAAQDAPSSLMECSVCYEIAHPNCVTMSGETTAGVINEDLPNSWECPICCKLGKNFDYRPRHFRARQKSAELPRLSASNHHEYPDGGGGVVEGNGNGPDGADDASSGSDSETPYKAINKMHNPNNPDTMYNASNPTIKMEIKEEIDEQKALQTDHQIGGGNNNGGMMMGQPMGGNSSTSTGPSLVKRRKSDDGNSMCSSMLDPMDDANASRKKSTLRTQLAQQIVSTSQKVLKRPAYPVRPAGTGGHQHSLALNSMPNVAPYLLDPTCMLAVFRYLPQDTLSTCALVCKSWCNFSVDPSLWKVMNCAQFKLTANLLTAIVRRQPETLVLDWTNLVKRQLAWVVARIPGLRSLSLQGVPIKSIFGLHTCLCPPLQMLDLSFVRSLNDPAIREILSPPKDSRPGLTDSKSRLRNLKVLKLAGTDISDVALRYITQGLPFLVTLDLSSCQRITDAGIAQIGTCASAIKTLVELDLSSCKLITELALDYLAKCEALTRLDVRHVPQVATQAVIKFAAKSKNDLQVQDVKLVDRRRLLAPPPSLYAS